MTGKTHKSGGMLCTLVGFLLLKWHNLLLPNVNDLLQFIVIYPFAMWGSVASDLDHHWDNCPDKSIPSYIVNKVLHIPTKTYKRLDMILTPRQKKESRSYKVCKILSANHRSWQTHSDLTLMFFIFLLFSTLNGNILGRVLTHAESTLLSLVLTGICIGIIAHFILDMLTPQGVWFTLGVVINRANKKNLLPEKIRVVPKMSLFATSSAWESFICSIIKKLTVVFTIIFLVDLVSPDMLTSMFDFLKSLSIEIS